MARSRRWPHPRRHLLRRQVPAHRPKVLAQLVLVPRADDDRGNGRALQEPVERDLRDLLAGFPGDDISAGDTLPVPICAEWRGPTGCRDLADPKNQGIYLRDGWNLTGDAFYQDEDDYFHFAARTDDITLSTGDNIAGPEVEAVPLSHPAVQDCAVIGAPDAGRGQIVRAHVVLAAGHHGDALMVRLLQDHVNKGIAPCKYPRRVIFAKALPKPATGKIQRFQLRDTTPEKS